MNLDAYILIGGRSTRLGRDKALVEVGGQTLAERAAKTIEAALAPMRITFVAGEEDRSGLKHHVISDLRPGFGAWSAIETALTSAQAEWILVIACDLPFVSVELLRLLADAIDDGIDAVVPEQPDGRLQPLCAFYRVKPVLAAVAARVNAQTSLPPVNAIFDDLNTLVMTQSEYCDLPGSENFFLNVNTAADLAEAIALNR